MSEPDKSAYVPADDAAEELATDVKRGARRAARTVRDAVADGAEAIEETVRPSFRERLVDGFKAATEEPSQAAQVARDIVRDHPIASAATIAFAALALGRLLRR